jgi:hypothetical protein
MNGTTFVIGMLVVLASFLIVPEVEAQSDNNHCIQMDNNAVLGLSVAGDSTLCVQFPTWVPMRGIYTITANVEGPDVVAVAGIPIAMTHAWTLQSVSGCTAGTVSQNIQNTLLGSNGAVSIPLTMTSDVCTGSLRLVLSVTGVGLVWQPLINFAIRVVQTDFDVTNRLCNFSATGDPCIQPVVTVEGVNLVVNNNLTSNGTMGNTTVNIEAEPPGFDGSLYVLLVAIGLALARTGEVRNNHGYRMVAGGIFLMAPFAMMKELERLGFNHMGNKSMSVALLFFAINWILAIYLLLPKDEEETQ